MTLTEQEKEQEQEKEKDTLSGKPDRSTVEIVEYLNAKCGTKYKPTTKKTQTLVNARAKEGFTVDDFKAVIDCKSSQWLNDPKMSAYLRPETLFGTKFEGYLNEKRPHGSDVLEQYGGDW